MPNRFSGRMVPIPLQKLISPSTFLRDYYLTNDRSQALLLSRWWDDGKQPTRHLGASCGARVHSLPWSNLNRRAELRNSARLRGFLLYPIFRSLSGINDLTVSQPMNRDPVVARITQPSPKPSGMGSILLRNIDTLKRRRDQEEAAASFQEQPSLASPKAWNLFTCTWFYLAPGLSLISVS